MESKKAKKKQIKKIVNELIILYAWGQFKEAKALSHHTRHLFESFCIEALAGDLSFIVKNCHHFEMTTADALELFAN